ncbi:MAG: hypothetical protein DRQ88_00370 [Epsilonproteobacteria bacterium]|nr:MAG: hypothetical protein DRQ89_03450 [Campylobacterota bacterium]RLA68090.1 MAG: hypothetical protein DRQ88_00370 [Campylobacterota bacterium]
MSTAHQEKKIRCFVIADDYRWHFLTDSIDEFEAKAKSYLDLMNSSGKENQYYFKNIFLTRDEYVDILKNIMYHSRKISKSTPNTKKDGPQLYIVD